MKRKIEHPYFCYQCKKISKQVEEFFLVEDNQCQTFCSERCIVEFFSPVIETYEKDEIKRREKIGIVDEAASVLRESQRHVEGTLSGPDQIYEEEDDLGRKHYTFVKEYNEGGESFWYIVLCFLYEGQPSFVFLQTATQSDELLSYYCSGDLVDGSDPTIDQSEREGFSKITLPPEVIEELELKKSTSLAQLMSERKESDIPIEQYPLYDDYISGTLEEPDEIYLYEDESGDQVYSYLKANEKEGTPFFYVVLCVKIDSQHSKQEHALYPIVCFPTVDPDLCVKFKQGEKVSGNILN